MSPNDAQMPAEAPQPAVAPAAAGDRPSLRLEDLLNEPIEFTLSDWADLPEPSFH